MFSISAAGVRELWAHRETLVIGFCLSWPYQCIAFMDNLELINQGMEGRMGFAFLSVSFIFFSFSFKHQLFYQRSVNPFRTVATQIQTWKSGCDKQLKRLCSYTPNPVFCLTLPLLFCFNVYNMHLPPALQHLTLIWFKKNSFKRIRAVCK